MSDLPSNRRGPRRPGFGRENRTDPARRAVHGADSRGLMTVIAHRPHPAIAIGPPASATLPPEPPTPRPEPARPVRQAPAPQTDGDSPMTRPMHHGRPHRRGGCRSLAGPRRPRRQRWPPPSPPFAAPLAQRGRQRGRWAPLGYDGPYSSPGLEGLCPAPSPPPSGAAATLPFGAQVAVNRGDRTGDWLRSELEDEPRRHVGGEVLRPARVGPGPAVEGRRAGRSPGAADGGPAYETPPGDGAQQSPPPSGKTEAGRAFRAPSGRRIGRHMYRFQVDDWTEGDDHSSMGH